jgi:hypothetical protein
MKTANISEWTKATLKEVKTTTNEKQGLLGHAELTCRIDKHGATDESTLLIPRLPDRQSRQATDFESN